jgi:hypothetical protein
MVTAGLLPIVSLPSLMPGTVCSTSVTVVAPEAAISSAVITVTCPGDLVFRLRGSPGGNNKIKRGFSLHDSPVVSIVILGKRGIESHAGKKNQ